MAFNLGENNCFFSKSLLSNRIPVDTKSFEVTRYLKVEKIDGSISEIKIPENIGNDIFQSGQMRSFDPLFSATIDSVYNDSPALYAGMQSGDVIVSVNGQSIYAVSYTHLTLPTKA